VQEIAARNPRAEALGWAQRVREEACDVLVLEPAPPAVDEPPWFADHEPEGSAVVRPFGPPEWRWETLAADDPALYEWCATRWLGPYRRLGELPASFEQTRAALHALALCVISPAREAANGKIGLRWTLGGFGTPFFGADAQVRVEADALVVQERRRAWRAPIETLEAARELLGELAGASRADGAEPLAVDGASAAALGELYGFASSVLAELRYGARKLEPSCVQLWPEHFDVAIELGNEAAGARATYGLSPGDADHPEPYLYVAPWGKTPAGELWQARGFSGAELAYADIVNSPSQRGAALAFYRAGLGQLTA